MDHRILSFPFLMLSLLLPFVFELLKIWKKSNNNPPPGPWRLPLIGNIHQLGGRHQPHLRLTDLARTYGPVMRLQLGQIEAVVISSAETAKQVMKTQESQFLGRPSLLAADIMLYNRTDISFAPYGDYWRQMKKIAVVELLSAKRVQAYKSVMDEEVSNFINFLYSKAGSPVNLTKTFYSLGNGIIAKTSIGKKFKKQETFLKVVDKAIRVAGGFSVGDAFPSFKLIHLITGISSTLHTAHQEADEILEEIISEHRASKTADGDDYEADNILGVLLDIQERGNLQVPLTTDNIKAIILDMFAGASDTSLTTAEWAMAEMVKHPRIMKKAQDEVRRTLNQEGNVANLLPELKYLKLVIKETLRLHPPVALIPRECDGRCELNGYDVNPKTKILVNAWAIGRDHNLWNDPERFDPERFLDNSSDFRGTDFKFIPFGAGKRICPGITMAITIIEVLLAQLLYHFDWKLPDGAKPESLDMSDTFGLVVKRRIDLNLIPIP
ncbi:hypothetical protein JCGZ_22599 [Jatropha curcas]|uniref:CYP726A25 n=1 Tax=Jatropha curcas TaxID=180498 RepID=A0A067JZU3_JATCU|nr:uncharacterized protein LOC105646159 precursor [Jatropha curcas]AIM47555.1 CYP726A25 [Jatropha curcas]KDP25064.1 hypothetical protein JCGZ_22599 [Jatropha curcas]